MNRYLLLLWLPVILFVWFGIPLLAWGIDDPSGLLSHPARAGLFASLALFLLVMLPFAISRMGSGEWGSPGAKGKLVRRQVHVRRLLMLGIAGILFATVRSDRSGFATLPDAFEPLRYVGLALFMTSIGLAVWANFTLGRQLSHEVTIQEGHELVTRGPFRLVRHPKYLGGLVILIALALTFRSWVPLAGYAFMLPLLLLRIRDEESLLEFEFGDRWRDYSNRTWRLVPLVY